MNRPGRLEILTGLVIIMTTAAFIIAGVAEDILANIMPNSFAEWWEALKP